MSIVCQLVEYSRAPVVNGVIRDVKVVGHKSVKGYFYPQPVLVKAIPLYEGAPVHICHGDARDMRQRKRSQQSHFGHLANVHERPGCTGLWGDLHIKQSHCMAGMIAESDGRDFGLSHLTRSRMNQARTEVLEILEVDSVDLVDDPGTTVNLFESMEDEEMDLAEMEASQKAQAEQIKTLTEGQSKIVTLLEGLQPRELDEPKKRKRISALSQVTDDSEGEETTPTFGHSREDFARGLRGISGGPF